MLQFQTGRYCGADEAAHCLRVAALSRRVVSYLPLADSVKQAVELGAVVHEVWSPVIQAADWPRMLEVLSAGQPLPSADACALAFRILAMRAGATGAPVSEADRVIKVAAEILEACNTFDEAVEFSAFERVAPAAAIAGFHQGIGSSFNRPVRQALTRATLSDAGARQYEHLPVLPKAALKIMRTSDENTSPAELQQIASTDPVLCARILQAANSARFGGREPVTRVTDAAARLGVPLARKVLLSACFAPMFASRALSDLWKHSQEIAAAAYEAARHASFDPDLAYTAGLLHDIGRLVFKSGSAASQAKLLTWKSDGFPGTYAETLTYGKDHAAVGAELLRNWELPKILVDAVEHHHQPEMSDSVLASLLFLAEEWHREKSGDAAEGIAAPLRRAHAEQTAGFTLEVFAPWEGRSELLAIAC